MKKSEKFIFLIQIVCIIFSILCMFLRNEISYYIVSLILAVIFLVLYLRIGFERERITEKKKIVKLTIFFTIGFLILIYSLGLFIGYVRSSYGKSIVTIFKNILPIFLYIVTSEFLRYEFCKKGSKSKIIIAATVIMFVLLDVLLKMPLYDISNKSKLLELICTVLLPSICKNYMLTDFAYKYGYSITLIYALIVGLYEFIVPIFPAYDIYLRAVVDILYPIFVLFMLNMFYKKEEKDDIRDRNIVSRVLTAIAIIFIVIVIALNSNLFRFWAAVIGSGSMTPTINIGDVVIVDKIYQEKLDRLKVQDVLVFKIRDKIYTHRIVDIDEANGEFFIKTKGDREGQQEDAWIVRNDDVIGVVKLKIRYIGYPTVWLSKIVNG